MKDRVRLFKAADSNSAFKYTCLVTVNGVEYEAALFPNVTKDEMIWYGGTMRKRDEQYQNKGE